MTPYLRPPVVDPVRQGDAAGRPPVVSPTGVPELPRGYVDRNRLWDQLDRATASAVTVLTAPAGAGKTLGVAGWVRRRRSSTATDGSGEVPRPLVWAAADRSWNAAVIRELLATPGPVGGGPAQTAPLIVIDDAHLLAPSVLAIIDEHLRSAPESLHLLLLSRWDPFPESVAAMLLGDLTTLRGEILRLDDREADALVRHHARTDDPEVLQAVRTCAGGWCAVLVLAARAIATLPDPRSAALDHLRTRIRAADRVMAEVFSTLTHRERHLLLCLGSEELITVPNAVTLSHDPFAADTLASLESTGLLLTRVGDAPVGSGDGPGYRVHPLLREVVRQRLCAGGVDVQAAQATVRRAVEADVARGDVTVGFDRSVAVENLDQATELLASEGVTMLARGHGSAIAAFLQHHPDRVIATPDTWFTVVVERWLAADLLGAQLWMERLLRRSADDAGSAVEVACVRLMRSRLGVEPFQDAVDHARRVASSRPESTGRDAGSVGSRVHTPASALLYAELGVVENWIGDPERAAGDLTRAVALGRSRRMPVLVADCLSHLAFSEYMAGREHAARRMAEEALAAAAESDLAPDSPTVTRAELALALCRFVDLPSVGEPDLTGAPADLHPADLNRADLSRADLHPADLCTRFWLHIHQARTRMHLGDVEGAGRALDLPLLVPPPGELPDHLRVTMLVERSFIGALTGDEHLLADLHRELRRHSWTGEADLVAGLRADLRGDRRRALDLFDAAARQISLPQLGTRALALTCQAQLLDALGDRRLALRRLQSAAAETAVRRNAAPFRGWCRQGTPIQALISELHDRAPSPWVTEIAAASADRPDVTVRFAGRTATAVEEARIPASVGTPPLSPREREVLRELGRGATYADISANLFVSQNTVKSHVSSLYQKLGAGRRSEALAIARSLHLL